MTLTDLMSGAGLVSYAEIGLAIFFITFAAITVWVIRQPREQMEAHARQVLENEMPVRKDDLLR
jgi:hypothetical protein